jgi:hypothetical protein
MRRIRYFALGLCLAAAGGAFAITTGGFPYLPTFGHVQVIGKAAANGDYTLKGNAAGASNFGIYAVTDSAGVRTGYFGDGSASNPDIQVGCDTNPCNIQLAPTGTGTVKTGSIVATANSVNEAIAGTASANHNAASFAGNATTSQSFGVSIAAGTNSSDYALLVRDVTGSNVYFRVDGAGNITATNAASVPWVAETTTTSTGTVTGCTTSPTTSIRFVKHGNLVQGYIPGVSCTSNSGSFTLTGAVPAGYQPTTSQNNYTTVTDNSTAQVGCVQVGASAILQVFLTGSCAGTFTSTGVKGISGQTAFSYVLN